MRARCVNAWGKFPTCCPGGIDLLRVEAEVVRVGEHLRERQTRLVEPARSGRARRRRGSCTARTCPRTRGDRLVTPSGSYRYTRLSETSVLLHRRQRRLPPAVVRDEEARERHQHQRRVEHVAALVLDERAELVVPALGHDLRVDAVTFPGPSRQIGGSAPVRRHADGAVERHPRHELAVDEACAARRASSDPLVGVVPVLAEPVDHARRCRSSRRGRRPRRRARRRRARDRVHRLAVDVELQLVGRRRCRCGRDASPCTRRGGPASPR